MTFKERYLYNPKTDILGKGGFARVFKAYDNLLKRTVALKIFSSEATEKYDLVAEISRVISLEHPSLCRYYDVAFVESVNGMGDEERIQIGVMEYLDGGDLKNYCHAHPEQQVKLLADVLKGLSFLHKRGIIHRDLKPANILIKNTEDGPVAKITDFGISKDVESSHTSSSLLMGTIEYMAPEQFSPSKYGIDGKIGTNLDLWSFGLMLYELVTRESLFGGRGGNSSAEVMGNILNGDVLEDKISTLPEPYLSIAKRCLIKDAVKRVQHADELLALLNSVSAKPSVNIKREDVDVSAGETQAFKSAGKEPSDDLVMPKKVVDVPVRSAVAETAVLPKSRKNSKLSLVAVIILIVVVVAGAFYFINGEVASSHLQPDKPLMDSIALKSQVHVKAEVPVKPNNTVSKAGNTDQQKWDKAFDAGYGMLAVERKGKWGFVNKSSGKIVVPLKYDTVLHFFLKNADVFINCEVGRKHWVIDLNGRPVREMRLEDDFSGGFDFSEGLSKFYDRKSSKIRYGFIDEDGNIVIPAIYDDVSKFSEGLVSVQKDGKYGYINKQGQVVAPIIYDYGNDFHNGKAEVRQNGKSFYIDKKGNQI